MSVYVRDGGRCKACGDVIAGRRAHIDHIIAKKDGGGDNAGNLQLLCDRCHGKKTRGEYGSDVDTDSQYSQGGRGVPKCHL